MSRAPLPAVGDRYAAPGVVSESEWHVAAVEADAVALRPAAPAPFGEPPWRLTRDELAAALRLGTLRRLP